MKPATIMVYAALSVVIILIFAFFTAQRKAQVEQTFFGKFIGGITKLIFPSRTESVVIAGTTVGSACKSVELPENNKQEGISLLAQAVVDCYKGGAYVYKNTNKCCYNIDATKIKYSIDEGEFKEALKTKGTIGQEVYSSGLCGAKYEWDSALPKPLTDRAGTFILCFDWQSWRKVHSLCSDVYLTYDNSNCD